MINQELIEWFDKWFARWFDMENKPPESSETYQLLNMTKDLIKRNEELTEDNLRLKVENKELSQHIDSLIN